MKVSLMSCGPRDGNLFDDSGDVNDDDDADSEPAPSSDDVDLDRPARRLPLVAGVRRETMPDSYAPPTIKESAPSSSAPAPEPERRVPAPPSDPVGLEMLRHAEVNPPPRAPRPFAELRDQMSPERRARLDAVAAEQEETRLIALTHLDKLERRAKSAARLRAIRAVKQFFDF